MECKIAYNKMASIKKNPTIRKDIILICSAVTFLSKCSTGNETTKLAIFKPTAIMQRFLKPLPMM